ncbi:hypothetical protein [Nonomuraea sp. NPDC049480]|uniref:hypothetical protein n=1 Tax=Nonomuraea sp. NPDC049480 TaxID=3364353 RepID=UPI00379DA8B6
MDVDDTRHISTVTSTSITAASHFIWGGQANLLVSPLKACQSRKASKDGRRCRAGWIVER